MEVDSRRAIESRIRLTTLGTPTSVPSSPTSGEHLPFPPKPIEDPKVKCLTMKGKFAVLGWHRYVVVIPDYRLVPTVSFPEPINDVRDAILWVLEHTQEINQGGTDAAVTADTENIFVMGHSAGSAYTASIAFHPSMLPLTVLKNNIRGLILQGGVYSFPIPKEGEEDPSSPVLQLYRTPRGIAENMPLALLERASEERIGALPEVMFWVSERDPGWIVSSNKELLEVFGRRTSRVGEELRVMKGHNHISPHWCLGTGEGEEWAVEVAEWIKEKVKKGL